MKYIVAVLSFLFSCFGVAIIMAVALLYIFRPESPANGGFLSEHIFDFSIGLIWRINSGDFTAGLGTQWWNLPGTIVGILAGLYSAKVALEGKKKRENA